MIKRLITVVLLAAALLPGASAQQRGTAFSGKHRIVMPMQQTNAPQQKVRNFAPTYARGLRVPAQPVDAHAIAARYAAVPPMRVLGDGTTLYGSMIYSDSWLTTGSRYGLYSFQAANDPAITLKHEMTGGYQANGGGCYADGKYYYNSYVYTDEMGYTFSTFVTLDVATGESTKVTQSFIQGSFDQSQITHDMTYDPTTGTIFAIAYIKQAVDEEGYFERFYPAISTIDTYTGFATPIAATPGFIAIACNNAGELYGITKGAESALYRINKESGECTRIGATGLNPEYVQSATFDPVTDKLYWAETELTGTSALYEVDVTTGRTSKICSFANNEEFTGIYIPAPVVADQAPAAATDLGATFAGASLSGTINFTVPTLTAGGKALSGELIAEVSLDGQSFKSPEVSAGQQVSIPVSFSTEGVHSFSVFITNEAGAGPRTGYSWYAGIDGPAAVTDLSITDDGNAHAVLSWTAPTTGRNGGYIDPAQLTYTIVRMPDAVTVASGIRTTSFTDRTTFKAQQVYYTVTAWCGTHEGAAADTETGLYGSGDELPVTYSFDTQAEYDLCTVIDNNKDWDAQYHWGGWAYTPTFSYTADLDPCVAYLYSPEGPADDYIFMPPFTAENGKKYRLTFKMWTKGDKEKLAVVAGPQAAVTAPVILAEKTYSHKDAQTFTVDFTASAAGNYYVGFHCTSDKKKFYLFIDDVCIDEVPETGAPAAVSGLSVKADATGALKATVSFAAPTKDAGGSALTAISEINVYRGNDNTVIHRFAAPAPGAQLSWTDENPVQGINTYRVVAVNAKGAGEKAMASTYVGVDIPTAVTELVLTEENGHPVVRWVAPETGQNNGYINPDELVYRIMRSDNTLMARAATGTEFVDTSLDGSSHQYFLYYQVEPISSAGAGDYALTDHIVYGDPYEGEFFESFDDASVSNDPWILYRVKGNKQLWTVRSTGSNPAVYDADYSGGLAAFESSTSYSRDEGRLVSPKLRIDNMDVPTFSFAFFHYPDEGTIAGEDAYTDRMVPEVCLPDGSYVALDEPLYVDDPNWDANWYLYVYDLSEFKKYGYVQLSFHGYAGNYNDVYVDYISLENNSNYDLVAYSFSGPNAVKAGRSAKYTYTVLNQGMKAVDSYTVKLMRDGTELMSIQSTEALYPARTASYTFEVPAGTAEEGKSYTYYATVVSTQDDVPGNNASGRITTRVLGPDVPQVRTLTGIATSESAVSLNWGEPDALHVEDSFENYAAFSIADIGDYTLVDGDAMPVYTFNDIDFPNSGQPAAFMVFNPVQLGIAPMLPEWTPASGTQVLAAFSPHDGNGSPVEANDWLISPAIHGGAISFKCKTANYEWGMEKFEVMYSTTTAEPAAFVSLSGKIEAPKDWTKMEYALPANAKYFAIHYVTNDGFIFYLDDLCYTAKCTLADEAFAGFRIYRDGRAIADLGTDARSYADTGVSKGEHTYGVSTLFAKHEGQAVSVTVNTDPSGIESISSALSVTAADGIIAIDGAAGAPVSVSDVAGKVLYSAAGTDAHRLSVATGAYIVTVGTKSYKLLVD